MPTAMQIRGLGPITMSVADLAHSEAFATEVMGMRRVRTYQSDDAAPATVHVFAMGEGGPAAELHMRVEPHLPRARQGAGAVHHVAFRIPDADYGAWVDRFDRYRLPSSGPVDRYYFRSLYIREPGGILYEIATDGPGFDADEPKESLGERLPCRPSWSRGAPPSSGG
ncbi:VOC family protein [Teichococcus aestuarii]|uniref:VOC family protein n=1 Tax=Teichococcus aestuarii TaxID=568898 RepID=UPI003615EA8A